MKTHLAIALLATMFAGSAHGEPARNLEGSYEIPASAEFQEINRHQVSVSAQNTANGMRLYYNLPAPIFGENGTGIELKDPTDHGVFSGFVGEKVNGAECTLVNRDLVCLIAYKAEVLATAITLPLTVRGQEKKLADTFLKEPRGILTVRNFLPAP